MNCRILCCILLALFPFSAVDVTGTDLSSVNYKLWTRTNPVSPYILDANLGNLTSSEFNDTLRTLFLIHGWLDNGIIQWILDAKTNYLNVSDCNVISVDWGHIASNLDYDTAASDMYLVANLTAGMINLLVNITNITTSMIHVTGHSLGGQMAGMIGYYVNTTGHGTLDRVTGLDPAGPDFYSVSSDRRIDQSDAIFVDVIHTNGGNIVDGYLGLFLAVGNVDFYPNGGKDQPGCDDIFDDCSHERAYDYWVESILAGHSSQFINDFWAWPCSSYSNFHNNGCPTCGQGCLKMGFWVDRNLTGKYYLRTHSSSPFAKGFNQ